ncbi:phage tail assembly chaperone [Notoacmeibacter ruber]|uniref:Uncharacterized protein n=1 Tax=Notoacmeibacter ruber TaxID=2670375 RepID=A0A3L7J8M4_9HYPH|nr:hypothetical protein [Notoacmeibacter ruber]RLQ87088.1 hypothetical protein D8780_01525 [Notoacmeibacter ruber]
MAEKKFGKLHLRTQDMLAKDALLLNARLMRHAAPVLTNFRAIVAGYGEGANEVDKAASDAAAMKAIGAILDSLQPADMVELMADILGLAEVKAENGKFEQVDMDTDFSTEKGQIIPAILWILQEQLGDFFGGALATAGNRVKAINP